jgi:serine/threonine protein kinase
VITLHDFGQANDGQFFLVMEMLVGRSLGDYRLQKGGRLPAAEAAAIIDQVLDAIKEAHSQGVVHRDLKPDNIFLLDSPPQFVKVLDFGLARIVGLESRLSDPNLLFGTPAYMSPEQAKGKASDHRADLYALGVILFELLTGQLPFQAASSLAILLKKFHRPAPRVRDVVPSADIPEALDTLVRFTWQYYLDHPEFLTLVNSENHHKGRHIKTSETIRKAFPPLISMVQSILDRGVAAGVFRKGVDPVQLNITIAAIGYYYLTNRFTGSFIYDRDFMEPKRLKERLEFDLETIRRLVSRF